MGQRSVIFALLGPPGSGKGTQGAILERHADMRHVSTGELFRNAVEAGTPAGLHAESYLVSGQLVPDEVVMQLVEEFITQQEGLDLCFDGFPRTKRQAETFDRMLEHLGKRLAGVIYINVSDAVALERLMQRGRSDDSPETAAYRLNVYHRLTEPLIDYYQNRSVLLEVSGEADIESVAQAVWDVVEAAR